MRDRVALGGTTKVMMCDARWQLKMMEMYENIWGIFKKIVDFGVLYKT